MLPTSVCSLSQSCFLLIMSSFTVKSATSLVFTFLWAHCADWFMSCLACPRCSLQYKELIFTWSLLILSDKYRLSLSAAISLHVGIIPWPLRSGRTALSPQNVTPSHCRLKITCNLYLSSTCWNPHRYAKWQGPYGINPPIIFAMYILIATQCCSCRTSEMARRFLCRRKRRYRPSPFSVWRHGLGPIMFPTSNWSSQQTFPVVHSV